jgi:hypothetical protein
MALLTLEFYLQKRIDNYELKKQISQNEKDIKKQKQSNKYSSKTYLNRFREVIILSGLYR